MDVALPLQELEHGKLATSTTSTLALSLAAKVASSTSISPLINAGLLEPRRSAMTSRNLWKNRIAVLRFTPDNSAAERAVAPAQKYLISSVCILRESLLRRRIVTI